MNYHITLRAAKIRLRENGIAYEELSIGNGWTLLLTQYGGRALGPFKGEEGESFLWLNGAFRDKEAFGQLIRDRGWNLGGERFWVNPELKFFCETPETFNETYTVQAQLDPGSYAIARENGRVRLNQSVRLRELGGEAVKEFRIDRRYAPAAHPLSWIDALKGIPMDYCGYIQEITLEDTSPETPLCLEPWTLCQVNPAGKFVVPFFGAFQFDDYYEPVGEMQRVKRGYAELDVTGWRKYKTAYKSAMTFGRIAYVTRFGEDWAVMIRNYYNDPSSPYVSEPWNQLGRRGSSAYFYNDDGSNGGFGEFEHGGLTAGPDTGRTRSENASSLWFFFGEREKISEVMRVLLGVEYAFPDEAS